MSGRTGLKHCGGFDAMEVQRVQSFHLLPGGPQSCGQIGQIFVGKVQAQGATQGGDGAFSYLTFRHFPDDHWDHYIVVGNESGSPGRPRAPDRRVS